MGNPLPLPIPLPPQPNKKGPPLPIFGFFLVAGKKSLVSTTLQQQQNSLHSTVDISSIFQPFHTSEVGFHIYSSRLTWWWCWFYCAIHFWHAFEILGVVSQNNFSLSWYLCTCISMDGGVWMVVHGWWCMVDGGAWWMVVHGVIFVNSWCCHPEWLSTGITRNKCFCFIQEGKCFFVLSWKVHCLPCIWYLLSLCIQCNSICLGIMMMNFTELINQSSNWHSFPFEGTWCLHLSLFQWPLMYQRGTFINKQVLQDLLSYGRCVWALYFPKHYHYILASFCLPF